jgi:hypothetical protein
MSTPATSAANQRLQLYGGLDGTVLTRVQDLSDYPIDSNLLSGNHHIKK